MTSCPPEAAQWSPCIVTTATTRTTDSLDTLREALTAGFWDERYAGSDRVWSGRPNQRLTEQVADLAPGTALDVACGEGGDAIWLAKQGWKVTAVDVSQVALARVADHAEDEGVSERLRLGFYDALEDPRPAGRHTFDLVTVRLPARPRRGLRRDLPGHRGGRRTRRPAARHRPPPARRRQRRAPRPRTRPALRAGPGAGGARRRGARLRLGGRGRRHPRARAADGRRPAGGARHGGAAAASYDLRGQRGLREPSAHAGRSTGMRPLDWGPDRRNPRGGDMQSNNPVFRRSEEFNRSGAGAYQQFGQPQYSGQPGYPAPQAPVQQGRMTIDSVVQSTAITLGITIIAAAATWFLTPDVDSTEAVSTLSAFLIIGSGAAFILSLVNSFKRVISPALVMVFAPAEGVALGALSKFYDAAFGANADMGGIVVQAVVGTFAAFGGTLAAYKFFDIKVGQKFRTFVIAAMFGMVALSLMEVVLGLFGNQMGLFGFGPLGLVFAIGGLVLGVFMLILDFDFVEQGIANGLPERESWRASFGLLVSLVWIYTNLLRILAILQQD
ncbi:Bax inhibitor-1/YccA family protein [Nocardioides convexus]|uniref:Bax inhibitor-1/YccA family membrane protein n=1 Tax=Nocardioides convexus TaxID=2712224 RepID=UPI0024189A4E|nr:Bax inhibitor-1/YccA family protein [Nocardioides convexus]